MSGTITVLIVLLVVSICSAAAAKWEQHQMVPAASLDAGKGELAALHQTLHVCILHAAGGAGTSLATSQFYIAGELHRLENKADTEGFVQHLLGTSCYSHGLRRISAQCQQLSDKQSLWLAWHFMNCFRSKTGKAEQPCSARWESVHDCAGRLKDQDYQLFHSFWSNVMNMCLFVANADFEKRVDATLNTLVHAGAEAAAEVCASPSMRHNKGDADRAWQVADA